MGKGSKAVPRFASWEEEDEFWATHSLTDLELEEDTTPLLIQRGALRYVKKNRSAQSSLHALMEKKDGIKVSSKGLFIPVKYFRRMGNRLEIVFSTGEIVIRSSKKRRAVAQRPRHRRLGSQS